MTRTSFVLELAAQRCENEFKRGTLTERNPGAFQGLPLNLRRLMLKRILGSGSLSLLYRGLRHLFTKETETMVARIHRLSFYSAETP